MVARSIWICLYLLLEQQLPLLACPYHQRSLRGCADHRDHGPVTERQLAAQAIYGNVTDIIHRRLPDDFEPCGAPLPTAMDKLELGLAHAWFDAAESGGNLTNLHHVTHRLLSSSSLLRHLGNKNKLKRKQRRKRRQQRPTASPTATPSSPPSSRPSSMPSHLPSSMPSASPTYQPSSNPTRQKKDMSMRRKSKRRRKKNQSPNLGRGPYGGKRFKGNKKKSFRGSGSNNNHGMSATRRSDNNNKGGMNRNGTNNMRNKKTTRMMPRKKRTPRPTPSPTPLPTESPTFHPTQTPTFHPTSAPTHNPTYAPTRNPTFRPTPRPTRKPTRPPMTRKPTPKPSPPPNPTTKRRKRKRGPVTDLSEPEFVEVPVYFHVFTTINNRGYISRQALASGFISELQRAYEVTPFRFRLKSVNYARNDDWFACDDMPDYKRTNRRGGPESLNIYVCDMASKGLGGTAFLPPMAVGSTPYLDGVNIMNPSLGMADFAHQALVHETGHWLGLLHTFQDGCEEASDYHYQSERSYYFNGDGVEDTPAHAQPTWGEPKSSYCWQNDRLNTCPDNPDRGYDLGLDPVDNYMNYLPAECLALARFTEGQIHRMKAEWHMFRE